MDTVEFTLVALELHSGGKSQKLPSNLHKIIPLYVLIDILRPLFIPYNNVVNIHCF